MLGSSTRSMLFLLVCIGLLADNRYKVSAMRHTEYFLRQTQTDKARVQPGEIAKHRSIGFQFKHTLEDQGTLRKNRRVLEEVNKNKVKDEETQEQKNKTGDDSFQASKRRVRRGSDPIHNKAQPFS
ncbi:PREDICTED: CLAVATA3/ESR (CLE)-related protein 45-like [Camelina sativa]|uniref:CLAVATA3/ESR (CLE)-related protein 45-like n=1 Tax=Camelina sativa TaxID=90675 RepID=A0ABM0WGZ2_CAMSA|nr:PREDICTED: CLAVATA3/ESR (CLE)-related protein 45-like [Camelina sativa]